MRWALVIASLLGALVGGVGYIVAFFGEFPVGASQAALAELFSSSPGPSRGSGTAEPERVLARAHEWYPFADQVHS